MKVFLITLAVFLAGIGTGTLLKYYDYYPLSIMQKLNILFILPFHTLAVTLRIYFRGIYKVYIVCLSRCGSITILGRIYVFFLVAVSGLWVCFKYMPILSSRIVINMVKNEEYKITHFYKKTFNDCFSILIGIWSSNRFCMQRCYK